MSFRTVYMVNVWRSFFQPAENQIIFRLSVPAPPVLSDTLFQWEEMGTVPESFTGDIWFTSPAKGFAAGAQLYQTADSGKTWTSVPGTSGNP